MSTLVGFLPFIAFAVLAGFGKTLLGLIVATALAVGAMLRSRSMKLLEVGSAVLFAILAVYAAVAPVPLSVLGASLAVNAGLTAIVLISLAVGRPFTLAYAREQVPASVWSSPVFLDVNRRITAVWAAAFLVMVAADLAQMYVPMVPVAAASMAGYAALAVAVWFTRWYPRLVRGRHGLPAAANPR